MKKKSPPYAIIGAVILGILAVVLFLKHEKDQQLAAATALKAEQDKEAAALAAATANQTTPSVSITPTDMRQVLYATQPVEPGIKISPAFYEKKLTPKDILPDAYTDATDITGWVAIRAIEKGDPLTPRNIGKSLPYMSQRISPGMRALSLPIFNADVNDTGGFIVDGDRVDLLYTTWTQDTNLAISTRLIMQNLNVLFVPGPTIKTEKTEGVNPVPPPGDPIAVTFEVTPEQAQALVFLTQIKNAKFSMILRARKDNSEIKIKPFAAIDYADNLNKVQATTDKSMLRVQALADQIAAEEKKNQGTTNEDTPTPPPAP